MARRKVEEQAETIVNHDEFRRVTIEEAIKLSRTEGARILWRPDGQVNYKNPGSDLAFFVE